MSNRRLGFALGVAAVVAGPLTESRESGVARAGDEPAVRPAVDAALAKRISECRDSGVRWLRKQLAPDGAFKVAGSVHACPAETAFMAFVLRSAGAPRNDPDLVRALRRMREDFRDRRASNTLIGHENYGRASVLLALERLAADVPGDPPNVVPLSDEDRAMAAECRRLLVKVQAGDGTFSYGVRASGVHDHSNTHWALLGLHAAKLLGMDTEETVWRKAAEHLLRAQEKGGPPVRRCVPAVAPRDGYAPVRPTEAGGPVDQARGWGYLDGSPSTGSMTAACLLSIAVCRDALRAAGRLDRSMDERTEKSIRDARAWLDLHFTVRENPGSTPARPPGKLGDLLGAAGADLDLSGYHYDWLAALESSQSFLRFDDVGTHDWFAETAEYLTTHQAPDGRWNLTPFDTCFAVLALSRSPWRIDERSWK